MIFAILGFIVFRGSMAYLFVEPLGLGATGVWYGEAAANVLMVLVACLYFLRGAWQEGVIDDSSQNDDSTSEEYRAVKNSGVED